MRFACHLGAVKQHRHDGGGEGGPDAADGVHGVLLVVRLVPLLAAAKVLPRHDRPHNSPYNSAALGFELGLPAGPFDDLPLMKVDRVVSRCAVPHCAVQPMMTLDYHVQWLAFDGPAAAGR